MDIEIATHDIIPEWLELAREVEPLFQASMADDPEFKAFTEIKIAKNEAIIARDKANHNALMGVITISHNNNRISWFAVFDKYKCMGVGTKLLEYAINELGNDKIIEVTTFQESDSDGVPARKVYQKFGFVDYDLTIKIDGHQRSLMKRFP